MNNTAEERKYVIRPRFLKFLPNVSDVSPVGIAPVAEHCEIGILAGVISCQGFFPLLTTTPRDPSRVKLARPYLLGEIYIVTFRPNYHKRHAKFQNSRRHFTFIQRRFSTKLSENFTEFSLRYR